jgi:hypothetical protein
VTEIPDASPIAYLALLLVLPATIAAFAWLRPTHAVLVVLFGSQLFLPELVCFDAPLIPPLNKQSLPALCMMGAALAVTASRARIGQARPGRGIDSLMILAMLAVIGTVLTNRDPLTYGPTTLSAHQPSDVLSEVIRMLLGPVILFFLGRTLFRTAGDARDVLKALVIAGVVYSPFIAIELRLSPQFHAWIYGFGQHSFEQTVRAGGWRPMVFMAHGLALALFMCATGIAAWALSRAKVPVLGVPAGPPGVFVSILLAIMNSLGALIYAAVIAPLQWFLKPKSQLRVAAVLAAIVAIYPVLRATDTFPRKELVNWAAQVNQDRAQSLEFRFTNEDILVQKALERPWFGWGGFARSHVYDQRGVDQSVVDGAWIGFFASYGIVGFVARFGLLLIPIFMARRALPRLGPSEQSLLAGVALISTVYVVDLLPNGMFNELPMFFAGTVTGLSQGMVTERARRISPELLARLLEFLRLRSAPRAREFRA